MHRKKRRNKQDVSQGPVKWESGGLIQIPFSWSNGLLNARYQRLIDMHMRPESKEQVNGVGFDRERDQRFELAFGPIGHFTLAVE